MDAETNGVSPISNSLFLYKPKIATKCLSILFLRFARIIQLAQDRDSVLTDLSVQLFSFLRFLAGPTYISKVFTNSITDGPCFRQRKEISNNVNEDNNNSHYLYIASRQPLPIKDARPQLSNCPETSSSHHRPSVAPAAVRGLGACYAIADLVRPQSSRVGNALLHPPSQRLPLGLERRG